MTTAFVAASKTVSEWAADIGLTKHVYWVGVAEDVADALALLNANEAVGATDWALLASAATHMDEATLLAKLAQKEIRLDPLYYPSLRGETGLVKVKPANVANHLLVQKALAGTEIKVPKVKEKDFGAYLLRHVG